MKKQKKDQRGITLIALVVTIIVLMIISGITVATLMGENGIIKRAGDAKKAIERAEIVENAKLDILAKITEKKGENITEDELVEILTSSNYNTQGRLSSEESVLNRTLTSKDGKYVIPVSEIYNGTLSPEIDTGYGLYDSTTGALKKSWAKLKKEGIITVNNNGLLTSQNHQNESNTLGNPNFENLSSDALDGRLVISNEVTALDDYALISCKKLTAVTIPDSVTRIGGRALSNCSNMRSIDFSQNITSIGAFAFAGSGLTGELNLPNSLSTIGSNAFGGCSNITSVVLHDDVKIIQEYAFAGCGNLSSINIPEKVTTIESNTFGGCSKLTVTVPNTITSVVAGAFGAVKQVYYNGSLNTSTWGAQKVDSY